MPRDVERRPSTLSVADPKVFQTWIENQKTKNGLKALEGNRKQLEEHFEREQRKILNHISYVNWFEKKNQELKQKKLEEQAEEERKKEQEMLERKKRREKDLNFNAWLERKEVDKKRTKERVSMEKRRNKNAEEMKRREKEQAEIVWKLWKDNKNVLKEEEDLKKKKEVEEKEKQLSERKCQSEQMFKEWIKKAKNKPKPVKSNLGFTSLSCQNVGFINPIPWKNILDDDGARKDPEVIELFRGKTKQASTVTSETDIFESKSSSFRRTADWVKSSNQIRKKAVKCDVRIKDTVLTPSSTTIVAKKSFATNLNRNKSVPACPTRKKTQIQLEKLLQISCY